ncbi:hypothetical protein B0H11DRAFT_1906538 [Mycena galericulata]|nr:hypothetical protein B0H11DRAFT_1906538 [Mycena galericulata]
MSSGWRRALVSTHRVEMEGGGGGGGGRCHKERVKKEKARNDHLRLDQQLELRAWDLRSELVLVAPACNAATYDDDVAQAKLVRRVQRPERRITVFKNCEAYSLGFRTSRSPFPWNRKCHASREAQHTLTPRTASTEPHMPAMEVVGLRQSQADEDLEFIANISCRRTWKITDGPKYTIHREGLRDCKDLREGGRRHNDAVRRLEAVARRMTVVGDQRRRRAAAVRASQFKAMGLGIEVEKNELSPAMPDGDGREGAVKYSPLCALIGGGAGWNGHPPHACRSVLDEHYANSESFEKGQRILWELTFMRRWLRRETCNSQIGIAAARIMVFEAVWVGASAETRGEQARSFLSKETIESALEPLAGHSVRKSQLIRCHVQSQSDGQHSTLVHGDAKRLSDEQAMGSFGDSDKAEASNLFKIEDVEVWLRSALATGMTGPASHSRACRNQTLTSKTALPANFHHSATSNMKLSNFLSRIASSSTPTATLSADNQTPSTPATVEAARQLQVLQLAQTLCTMCQQTDILSEELEEVLIDIVDTLENETDSAAAEVDALQVAAAAEEAEIVNEQKQIQTLSKQLRSTIGTARYDAWTRSRASISRAKATLPLQASTAANIQAATKVVPWPAVLVLGHRAYRT